MVSFDEFVEALIDRDPGRALTAMAHAINAGHEPRPLAEALVRHLRNGFLSLMAPELVQLSPAQVDALAAQAQRLGPAALVRAIERLGEILVELRHAPDPRVLVEVALVQLASPAPASGGDIAPLAARVTAARAGAGRWQRRRTTAGAGRPGDRPHGARRAGPTSGDRPPPPPPPARSGRSGQPTARPRALGDGVPSTTCGE